MLYFILASHSQLAAGMKSTIKMLTGIDKPITTFGLSEDGNVNELAEEIEQQVKALLPSDQAIILTDIPGGSVNNSLLNLIKLPNVFLVSGMNLPLVINLVLENHITKTELNHAINEARKNIKLMNEYIPRRNELKGDDFFD